MTNCARKGRQPSAFSIQKKVKSYEKDPDYRNRGCSTHELQRDADRDDLV